MRLRAPVFLGAGWPFELRELEARPPGPHDVVVRMAAVGICGSDLHVVKGEWPRPTPMVIGHEGAGVVEEIGSEVDSLRPGDRVVLSWAPACGECGPCRRGRPAACEPLRVAIGKGVCLDGTTGLSLDGQLVHRMTATGCLAELCVVPASAALPLDEGVSLEEAALLGCAALTGVGAAVNAAKVTPGSSVLVVGAGGVGQFCVQGARIAGAARILCVDPLPARLEAAARLGATDVCAPGELETRLRELVGEGFDFTLDAVGAPETTATALRSARGGGTACVVGMPAAGARLDLEPAEFTVREKTLTGTLYGSEDPAVMLPKLVGWVREGKLELASLVGPSYSLEQVNEAVADALGGNPKRVIVTP